MTARHTPPAQNEAFLLVAVADPVLHPEAVHVAAATTRPVVDLTEVADGDRLRRYAARAAAVLIDAEFADHIVDPPPRAPVYFCTSDRTPMDWEKALAARAEKAFILPAQSAELLTALSTLAEPQAQGQSGPGGNRGSSATIGVTASAGGAGTSTFAAALARAAGKRGAPVTLIDADPTSGGLDLLLGIEDTPGARWPDLVLTETGGIDPDDLRGALPATGDGIAVLTAARSRIDDPFRLETPMVARIVDALAGAPGWTIVDIPPGAEVPGVDAVALLVPAEVRPAAAAVRLLAGLRARKIGTHVISRRREWSGLDDSDLAKLLGVEPAASLKNIPALAKDAEISGLPARLPNPLREAAAAILTRAGGTDV